MQSGHFRQHQHPYNDHSQSACNIKNMCAHLDKTYREMEAPKHCIKHNMHPQQNKPRDMVQDVHACQTAKQHYLTLHCAYLPPHLCTSDVRLSASSEKTLHLMVATFCPSPGGICPVMADLDWERSAWVCRANPEALAWTVEALNPKALAGIKPPFIGRGAQVTLDLTWLLVGSRTGRGRAPRARAGTPRRTSV